MGDGGWNVDTHQARTAAKKARGADPFDYDQHLRQTVPQSRWTVHGTLDPKIKAGDQSPHAGQVMRECMISDEHPDPTPIAVLFDVTASMGTIPRILQTKLAELHGLLVRKGYCTDPQIMFGGVGDANCDRLPLQIGQFESDNRMDENLESIVLEGGGGGHMHETYELAAYFLKEHTFLDPFEKHGKKGYAFFIGDERAYPQVNRRHIEQHIGDTLEADPATADVFAALQARYHVFFIYPVQGSYDRGQIIGSTTDTTGRYGYASVPWAVLLGERAVELEDPDAVCEAIATTVGLIEGTVTLDDALDDLKDVGASDSARQAVGKALAPVGAGASAVATSSGDLPGLQD